MFNTKKLLAENKKQDDTIRSLSGRLAGLQSKLDRFIKECDEQKDGFSDGLLKMMFKLTGYKLYKVVNSRESGLSFFHSFAWTGYYTEKDFEDITIDKLQTIGKYETFTVGKDTYAIVTKPKKTNKK